MTSQLVIIDDLSKSSHGQVRMQGAREGVRQAGQCRGFEGGLRLPFNRRAGLGKSFQHSECPFPCVWKGDNATVHTGF